MCREVATNPANKKAGHCCPAFSILLGGGRSACREEGGQFADIGLIGPGQVVATRRTAAARTALAWLAGLAFGFHGLLASGLDGLGSGRLRLLGSDGLLALAFGTETVTARTIAAFAARLALAILVVLARWALFALALARLFAFTLRLVAILLHILLLGLRLRRREARVHLGHIVIIIGIIRPIRPLAVLGLLGAGDDAEIVLGVLEIVLRHHRIAR